MEAIPIDDPREHRYPGFAAAQVPGLAAAPMGAVRFRQLDARRPSYAFRSLPEPTGQPPFHLALDTVVPAARIAAIQSAGRLVFHATGDTGGVKEPGPQLVVASHMVDDCLVADPGDRPAFFYHLGDVVYFYGAAEEYYPQFFDPYA